MACAATSRTTWSSRRTSTIRAWHPGVQPVRQGAAADAADDGAVRRAAGRPAGPGLPRIRSSPPCATCWKRPPSTASVGARPPDPAGQPVEVKLRRLGKLRRRRRAADAPRDDAGRGGPLVHPRGQAQCGFQGHRDERLETGAAPGYGWPLGERDWVNPSPNAPNLSMARCYPGTVMLEGTTLSEGRGTTRRWSCSARRTSTPRRSSKSWLH